MIDHFLPYHAPQDKPGMNLYGWHNRDRRFVCRACGSEFTARAPRAEWCGCCRVLRLKIRREMAAKRTAKSFIPQST